MKTTHQTKASRITRNIDGLYAVTVTGSDKTVFCDSLASAMQCAYGFMRNMSSAA